MSNESDELTSLRAENARLIALLESHDIDWRHDPAPTTPSASPPSETSDLSTAEKVALFRCLFRGRTDVHPVRWEIATTGRLGYAPACANEWRPGICEKPRVIGCAENFPQHIGLPRGCLDAAQELLRSNRIRCDIHDERIGGTPVDVEFAGTLRPDQEDAVAAMLPHDVGVLCAPTAFGKTVTGAAIIARRRVNTLILVHRTELLRQWQERLNAFLGIGKGVTIVRPATTRDVILIVFDSGGLRSV